MVGSEHKKSPASYELRGRDREESLDMTTLAKHAKPWTPLSRKSDRVQAVRRHAGKHRA